MSRLQTHLTRRARARFLSFSQTCIFHTSEWFCLSLNNSTYSQITRQSETQGVIFPHPYSYKSRLLFWHWLVFVRAPCATIRWQFVASNICPIRARLGCSAGAGIYPIQVGILKTPKFSTASLPGSAYLSVSSRARVQTPPPLPWKLVVFSPGPNLQIHMNVYLLFMLYIVISLYIYIYSYKFIHS